MDEPGWKAVYKDEAVWLGRIGRVLIDVEMPKIESDFRVTSLSRRSHRGRDPYDDGGRQSSSTETLDEAIDRRRAATLSLIGLNIVEHGQWEDDEMVVALDPVLIGLAVDAADDVPPPASAD